MNKLFCFSIAFSLFLISGCNSNNSKKETNDTTATAPPDSSSSLSTKDTYREPVSQPEPNTTDPNQSVEEIMNEPSMTCDFLNGRWKVNAADDNTILAGEETWSFRCTGAENNLTGARTIIVEPVGISLALMNSAADGPIRGELQGNATFVYTNLHIRYDLLVYRKGGVVKAMLSGSPSSGTGRALRTQEFVLTR